MRPFLLVAVAANALSPPASAQSQAHPTGMYWATGSCSRLVTPDGDHTAECNKALGLIHYSNGRNSYWFSIPHKSLIAFSGFVEDSKLKLDMVTIASTPNSRPSEASGSCNLDDPWKGSVHIRCQGTTAEGEFAADFTTDGKVPQGKSSE